jgi:Putative DNA-binding domain
MPRDSQPSAVGFQHRFAAALLKPSAAPPLSVVVRQGKATHRRFNVYRNNVVVSLIEALAAIYPAVQRITGPVFFRAMARFHVRAAPPRSPLLFEYGQEFPDFIDHYPYARELPWLGDVARIERAWLDACHAADAAPLTPEMLAAIPQPNLGKLRFSAHPAARIVRSRYSAGSIFTMNRTDGPVSRLDASSAEDVLITRPGMEVEVRSLPAGGAVFLSSLIAGATLNIAADKAFEDSSSFDLAASLAGLLEAGVFTDLHSRS